MTISRKSRVEPFFDNPAAQTFDDVDGEDNSKIEVDRVAELEELLRQSREREELRQEQILLQQPTHFQSQVTETEVKPESIALPDPAVDPDGFAKAMEQRIEIRMENDRKREASKRNRDRDIDDKIEKLWDDFGAQFPDLGDPKEKKRVEFAASQVIANATKRGIDINRYMFTTQGKFFKDVAKEYDDVFGGTDNEDAYADEAPAARGRQPRARNRAENEPVGRTAGLFGGNEGGRRTARKIEDDEENSGGMIEDLQRTQRKSGFF